MMLSGCDKLNLYKQKNTLFYVYEKDVTYINFFNLFL